MAVFCSVAFWLPAQKIRPVWPNTPPAPGQDTIVLLGIGDAQLGYRTASFELQQMGNVGGQTTPLSGYDYNRLGEWFQVLHKIDPRAEYVPFQAAYYFGATQNSAQLDPVIEYLEQAGKAPGENKWRWLAHAVYLADRVQNNPNKALRLAAELRDLKVKKPAWADQLAAFINVRHGDRRSALILMTGMLEDLTHKDPLTHADQVEIHFLLEYICGRLLTGAEAKNEPLCHSSLRKKGRESPSQDTSYPEFE